MKRKPSQMRRASTKIEAWRAQDESKSRYQPATSVVVVRLAGQEMKNTTDHEW